MNFHAIGPIAFMNHICGIDYKYHMCLAQYLYDERGEPTDYMMFYRRRCMLDRYSVILDNGVYEGVKMSYDRLLRAALDLRPKVVILPDVPHDREATIVGGEAFKKMLKLEGYKGSTMTVVHAKPGDYGDFVYAHDQARKQSRYVGISRLTQDFGLGFTGLLRRANFFEALKEGNQISYQNSYHALGMREGSLEELASLQRAGFDSVDSSAPIWRGLNKCELGNDWEDIPFNPNEIPTEYFGTSVYLKNANYNWEEVQKVCTSTSVLA